ncbi:MAG: tetratricopeptide repeat-containing glycosyltransferase family protein [Planctomycetota bacterium]
MSRQTVSQVLQHAWQIHQSGNHSGAERIYRDVLAQVPSSANAHVYLGIVLFDQRRFQESVESYRRAVSLQDPFPVAWNNLGNSLRMLGDVDEAERCFARALEQQPGYLSALKNRGTLWIWSGQVERGLRWYEEGLRVDPDNAELHRNLGVIYLLQGRFDEGWPQYRWRWRMPGSQRPAIAGQLWQGEPLRGKSILLYPEQGRGDVIQFIRMASVLKAEGATVLVQAKPEMVPLLSSALGIDSLLVEGLAPGQVDYQCSLLDAVDAHFQRTGSLPYAQELFDRRAGYLSVSDALTDYWARWLQQACGDVSGDDAAGRRRRIGINWQGNPQHHADVYRSLPLEQLEPLSRLPNTQLVSLQFGAGSDQLSTCSFSDSIVQLPDSLDATGGAFTDTAGVLKNLDHVVTSDTAIAHLAGAMGIPVLVLLGRVPDWRWLMQGDQSPWYPTMTLVRQQQLGDWTDVVLDACRCLAVDGA